MPIDENQIHYNVYSNDNNKEQNRDDFRHILARPGQQRACYITTSKRGRKEISAAASEQDQRWLRQGNETMHWRSCAGTEGALEAQFSRASSAQGGAGRSNEDEGLATGRRGVSGTRFGTRAPVPNQTPHPSRGFMDRAVKLRPSPLRTLTL